MTLTGRWLVSVPDSVFAGGNCARMANLKAFLSQRMETEGFWQTVVGWFQTHPWLTHRVEAVNLFASRAQI